MTTNTVVAGIGAAAALVAAGFWRWASLVTVPNNIDTFIGALQWIGRLNAYGAMAAVVGALCATYLFARQIRHGSGFQRR